MKMISSVSIINVNNEIPSQVLFYVSSTFLLEMCKINVLSVKNDLDASNGN